MTVGVGVIFNSVSKIIRDCISFALLLFVIGPENSHHSISQSNAKLKPMTNLIAHVFPRFRKLAWFYFEFSLALKSSFLSSVWPLWLLWVFFYDTIKKSYRALLSNALLSDVKLKEEEHLLWLPVKPGTAYCYLCRK